MKGPERQFRGRKKGREKREGEKEGEKEEGRGVRPFYFIYYSTQHT